MRRGREVKTVQRRWFPLLVLVFGVLFVIAGLAEKMCNRDGALRRGKVFVYWYQTVGAGAVAVVGSLYVLLKRKQ